MTDVVMLEAALFQLKTAIDSVTDEMVAPQLRLSMSVLSNAVEAAGQSPSPAAVNDVEFALNDVAAMVGELSAIEQSPSQLLHDSVADDSPGLSAVLFKARINSHLSPEV